jgi:hypothetical protein
MGIITHFNTNWYTLFFGFLLSWLFLIIARRTFGNWKEIKEQISLASVGLFAVALMEIYAVSTNLWNYIPENWPIILWPTYFVAMLFGYQLLKLIEGIFENASFI